MKKKIFTLTVVTLGLLMFNLALRFENGLSFIFLMLSISFFLIITLSFIAIRSYGKLENTELEETGE
jgi:hypothetical protein